MALFDNLQNLNPHQLQFLMQMLQGRGMMPPGGAPMGNLPTPGAPMMGGAPPQMTPQQALMQQQLNPQASPMTQVLQQLAQIQQMQAQQGQQGQQGNALLARINPQVAAVMQMLSRQAGAGGGMMPPSSGVGTA